MASVVLLDGGTEIPLDVGSLETFRRWALSDEFPERGRIDFFDGRIEVEMSPEDLFCHGGLKIELIRVLSQHVRSHKLGHLFADRARVTCPEAALSVEPDLVFVRHESLQQQRVRLVPKQGQQRRRYVEMQGPPDMVAEIVSDASVGKDTQRLPVAYFAAGVTEFWLLDARGEEPLFQIHARGRAAFEPVGPDAEGFQHSAVMGRRYRLDAERDDLDNWAFDLCEAAPRRA